MKKEEMNIVSAAEIYGLSGRTTGVSLEMWEKSTFQVREEGLQDFRQKNSFCEGGTGACGHCAKEGEANGEKTEELTIEKKEDSRIIMSV